MFATDFDGARISEANNSELQTEQCHSTKFPLEISEILLAEWGVSKRWGRGLSFFKECSFRAKDRVRVDTNP